MYYGRKKGLIILLVLILLILLLVTGGLAFVFFGTDLLKPNDELFFKYIGKSIEEMQITENSQITSVLKLQQQQPYTVEGSLGMNFESNSTYQTIDNKKAPKIEYNAKVDPLEEKAYAKAELKANDSSIFAIEYAQGNNIQALKSDEIASAFVGIENKDLALLGQKMGLSFSVSDEIQTQNIFDAFILNETEKKHIIETYANVLKENIPTTSFKKENGIATVRDGIQYDTTGYRVDLTDAQIKKLEIALLQKLKQDNVTLNLIANKAAIIGLGEDFTDPSLLTNQIDNIILNIQNDTNVGDDISIIVYVANGEVITTELIVKNNIKFTIYNKKTDNGIVRTILIENFDIDAQVNAAKVTLVETNTATRTTRDISIELDTNQTITINIDNQGSAEQQFLNTTIEGAITTPEGNEYKVDFQQKIQFVDEITDIIELSRNNCAVLNDYTAEQVQPLVKSLLERVQQVAIEKIDIIDDFFGQNANQVINPAINEVVKEQEIATFNSNFESYAGKISGTSLNTLNTVVNENNNKSDSKKVVLTVNGINTTGDNAQIDTTKTYNVEMKKNEEGYISEIIAIDDSIIQSGFDYAADRAANGVNEYRESEARDQALINQVNSVLDQLTQY